MSADFYRGVLKILKYQFCCGDDVTKVTNETTGMILAASADSLGMCDSASGGKMMFAISLFTIMFKSVLKSGWLRTAKNTDVFTRGQR